LTILALAVLEISLGLKI